MTQQVLSELCVSERRGPTSLSQNVWDRNRWKSVSVGTTLILVFWYIGVLEKMLIGTRKMVLLLNKGFEHNDKPSGSIRSGALPL